MHEVVPGSEEEEEERELGVQEKDSLFDIEITVRLSTEGSPVVMSPLIAQLCRGVQATGSLAVAAKQIPVAYSMAWKHVRLVERDLGMPLMVRAPGKGSHLTLAGRRLLTAYTVIEERANESFLPVLQNLARK